MSGSNKRKLADLESQVHYLQNLINEMVDEQGTMTSSETNTAPHVCYECINDADDISQDNFYDLPPDEIIKLSDKRCYWLPPLLQSFEFTLNQPNVVPLQTPFRRILTDLELAEIYVHCASNDIQMEPKTARHLYDKLRSLRFQSESCNIQ